MSTDATAGTVLTKILIAGFGLIQFHNNCPICLIRLHQVIFSEIHSRVYKTRMITPSDEKSSSHHSARFGSDNSVDAQQIDLPRGMVMLLL